MWAFQDLRAGIRPDTVSAISIVVSPHAQGTGLSAHMLAAMRDNAAAQGFREVVAPVRPSAKHLEPRTPIAEYAYRVREDGLPHDPWLRVHARAGATIVAMAPTSMCVAASLEEWRAWTGLPFDSEGEIEVPGALAPVRCDVEHGYGVTSSPTCGCGTPCDRRPVTGGPVARFSRSGRPGRGSRRWACGPRPACRSR